MRRRVRLIVIALLAVGAAGAGCGDEGGADVAVAGTAVDIEPAGDTVEVTRVSPPSADRQSVVVIVENGSDETIDSGLVVGDVVDGAGAPVTRGSGAVVSPRRIGPGELGIARVGFPMALPDPFTVEWSVSDSEGEAGRFDLPLSRFELSGDAVRVDVRNNRDGNVIVVEVRYVCLDEAGNAIDLVVVPGPAGRVPSDGQVTVDGPTPAGCVGAIGGAVGRTP